MLVRVIVIFAGVMTMVPVLIYLERKVVALYQFRLGPNRCGPMGAMQPLADALKLMMKEDTFPAGADRFVYYLAPLLAIVPALMACAVIPFGPAPWTRVTQLNHSLLYSLALSALSVYAITLAGWASNNKYSLMGALRASAQMISYEMGMGLSIITLLMVTQSLNLAEIAQGQHDHGWNVLRGSLFIAFFVYITCGIAETNRAPFDLAEAESELVAGFHTEYSSFKFAMFFMAEYVNMVTISALATTLFFGGWSGPGVMADAATGQLSAFQPQKSSLVSSASSDAANGTIDIHFLNPLSSSAQNIANYTVVSNDTTVPVQSIVYAGDAVTLNLSRGALAPGALSVQWHGLETSDGAAVPVGSLGLAAHYAIGVALLGVVYFLIKTFAFLFLYFWLRASLPRFRYDQLMHFGWKTLVPLSLANIFVMALFIAWCGKWFSV